MPERALQAENLHLWRGDRHVLRGVNFAITNSQCLQITGSNGMGKTSLLRTLSALMYPEEGRVLWNGKNIRQDLPGYHRDLAYIGHDTPLKGDLTPRENLRFWVGTKRKLYPDEIEQALGRVGAELHGYDRPVRTLSAGQKRRVALAGLLLMAAPLWLLDEPTTNLDADGQKLVVGLIEEHLGRRGLVVAAIHHDLPVSASAVRRLELAVADSTPPPKPAMTRVTVSGAPAAAT